MQWTIQTNALKGAVCRLRLQVHAGTAAAVIIVRDFAADADIRFQGHGKESFGFGMVRDGDD